MISITFALEKMSGPSCAEWTRLYPLTRFLPPFAAKCATGSANVRGRLLAAVMYSLEKSDYTGRASGTRIDDISLQAFNDISRSEMSTAAISPRRLPRRYRERWARGPSLPEW